MSDSITIGGSGELALNNTAVIGVADNAINSGKVMDNVRKTLTATIGNIDFLNRNSGNTQEIAELAKEYLQKYSFESFRSTRNYEYLSRVISIKDFEKNKLAYIDKLSKGIGSFPLEIDFGALGQIFNIGLGFDYRGFIEFQHSGLGGTHTQTHALGLALKHAKVSDATNTDAYIKMDVFNFLANYSKLHEIVSNEFDTHEKKRAVEIIELYKLFSLSILSTTLNITIKDPLEVLDPSNKGNQTKSKIDTSNPFLPVNNDEYEAVSSIRELILLNIKGTSQKDIDELLPIKNYNDFSILVEETIRIILEKNKKKVWLDKKSQSKNLDEYTLTELTAFAVCISRSIIDEYGKLEDMVKDLLNFSGNGKIKGKCTDYTGLSLQIINNYFKVKYPEKFEGIHFGYDTQNIGDYNHVYMKAFRISQDGGIDACFFDPTMLASHGLSEMKNPKDIFTKIDASNLPIQIDRSAEDLMNTFRLKSLREKGIIGVIKNVGDRIKSIEFKK